MAINNEPTIQPRTVTGIFTNYIAKVLPLAFDDSMSYYECLCALLKYINDTIVPDINNTNDGLGELQGFYTELQSYVNTYFDNLDVQEEINNKLDQMVTTGELQELLSSQYDLLSETVNNRIDVIETKVNHATSGSPLVASSTSGMTDTNRIYVNTTDGNWYYYNGSSWAVGGTYQSTSLGSETVDINNLSTKVNKAIYGTGTIDDLGNSYSSGNYYTTPMYLKKGTTITVSDDFLTKYNWNLRRINNVNNYSNIFTVGNDSSYTLLNDEYCCFQAVCKSGTWGDEDHPYTKFTSEDISLTYYYPLMNNSKLLDIDGGLFKNLFMGGTVTGSTRTFNYSSGTRASMCKIIKSAYPLYINCKPGYKFGVIKWSSSNQGTASFISDSGWITSGNYYIPADTYFSINFALINDGSLANIDLSNIITLSNYPTFTYLDDKIEDTLAGLEGDYSYYGQDLFLKRKHTFDSELLMQTTLATTSSQGFDIYGNYLVQLYQGSGSSIQIIDLTTKEQVSLIENVSFNHGDCCQFSKVKYDSSDMFPLLYVISDTSPAIVHIVRISNSTTATIVKKYNLGTDVGYYSGQCFDFDNNLLYSFGYSNNDYQTNTNNNHIIVKVFNMNNETLIADNIYSLELIDSYTLPFIYCIQGQKFLNGNCYLVSSYNSAVQTTRIYVFNPLQKKIIATITDLPAEIKNNETEDIAFIEGDTSYNMVVGTREIYDILEFK